MADSLNGACVLDVILKQGQSSTKSAAYFWVNVTQGVQDFNNSALVVNSSRWISYGGYKASKDFARENVMCGTLFCVSNGLLNAKGILIYCPIPVKITTVSVLKVPL